ncbi:MAG: hypothetical protein K0R14_1711 [Burkholderiales bacterium]|jgi:hypothetical protein|nr:hypothetical protein [Burkholderiales bacterium]
MLKRIQTVKRFSLISVISVSLAACGSGSNGGSAATRSPVDPNAAYGIVEGAAVPLTGTLLAAYTPAVLQGFMITSPTVAATLGFNTYGVCNGLGSGGGAQLLCQSNQAAINANPTFSTIFPNSGATVNVGNFVVAGAAALGIELVQPYRITYTTAGAPYQFAGNATNPQTVSAAVLVPQIAPGVALPASRIKGVVLFYHGTILSKGGVPSDFDGTLTPISNSSPTTVPTYVNSSAGTSYVQDATLAAVFATQGYVVVAPDYVGQGANYQVQHPYVIFPETNAQSGLNALKAARTALAAQGITLPNPSKLYISSYSEGGAYALWASQLAQSSYANFLSTNGFTLRRTVGISGAYDLSGATLHYEFANASNSIDPTVNTWNVSPGIIPSSPLITPAVKAAARVIAANNLAASKTSLAGYVLTALAYYNSSTASVNVLAPNYSPMATCVNWNVLNSTGSYPETGTATPESSFTSCPLPYNIIGTYNTSGLTEAQIADQSFAAATAATVGPNAYFTGGQTYDALNTNLATGYTNNSVGSFVEPGILNDQTITSFIAQQNIQSAVTHSPTDLVFLNYDSTVSNINSLEACGNLPSSSQFPGYQPGYTGGMKQVSPAGMVNCINFANNGIGALPQLFTMVGIVPVMIDHSQANAVLQLVALNQITANP